MVMLVPDDFSQSSLSSVITTRQGKGYVPYVTQAGGPGLGVLVSQGWFVLPTTPPKLPTSGVKSSVWIPTLSATMHSEHTSSAEC